MLMTYSYNYSHIHSKDDCISSQQDLNALEQWSLKWQLMLCNPTKCEFLRITNRKSPVIHTYYIATSPQHQRSHQPSILECLLTINLHGMITYSQSRTSKCFYSYRNLRQCPSHIKAMYYKSMVLPIVEYASSVYGTLTLLSISKDLNLFKDVTVLQDFV